MSSEYEEIVGPIAFRKLGERRIEGGVVLVVVVLGLRDMPHSFECGIRGADVEDLADPGDAVAKRKPADDAENEIGMRVGEAKQPVGDLDRMADRDRDRAVDAGLRDKRSEVLRQKDSGALLSRAVADSLGMDPSYFSRVFKRVHGISPSAFLKRHGEVELEAR